MGDTSQSARASLPDPRPHPCRLYGFQASEVPIVVLLRRGPSAWVQLIEWQTDTDTFTDGQWFKGRVYAEKCDLSPDGQLLVYFASKQGRTRHHSATHPVAWTAVSRPPYFTALLLWPQQTTFHGGGVFRAKRTLLVNRTESSGPSPPATGYLRVEEVRFRGLPGDEPAALPLEYHRLREQRQGWQRLTESPYAQTLEQVRASLPTLSVAQHLFRRLDKEPTIWQKRHPAGRFLLMKVLYGWDTTQYGSSLVQEWTVVDLLTQRAEPIEQASWVDWDTRGRLIYTRGGQVWATLPEQFPEEAMCLADLNERLPAPAPSPAWAHAWP